MPEKIDSEKSMDELVQKIGKLADDMKNHVQRAVNLYSNEYREMWDEQENHSSDYKTT